MSVLNIVEFIVVFSVTFMNTTMNSILDTLYTTEPTSNGYENFSFCNRFCSLCNERLASLYDVCGFIKQFFKQKSFWLGLGGVFYNNDSYHMLVFGHRPKLKARAKVSNFRGLTTVS